MSYIAVVYSDPGIGGVFGAHTWVELTDNNGSKSVYSYVPAGNSVVVSAVESVFIPVEGAFNPTDESEARKERSDKTTLDLTPQINF